MELKQLESDYFHKETGKEVPVTHRAYKQVLEELRLPPDSLGQNKKVLSIGEGLSDFVIQLRKAGIDAIAMDPIYNFDIEDTSDHQKPISELVNRNDPQKAKFLDLGNANILSAEDFIREGKLVAGSVYHTPFKDGSFDFVLLTRVLEHIYLDKALPEVIRVINEQGEVRFSNAHDFTIWGTKKLLMPADLNLQYDGYSGEWESRQGLKEGIEYLLRMGLSCYITASEFTSGKKKRLVKDIHDEQEFHNGGQLVIRKDDQWPQFVKANTPESRPNNQLSGASFKILPSDQNGSLHGIPLFTLSDPHGIK